MLYSTRRDAGIDIADETLTIPNSGFSSAINWLFRIVALALTAFAAYRGAIAGMVEKLASLREGRSVSYAKIGDFMTDLIPDSD